MTHMRNSLAPHLPVTPWDAEQVQKAAAAAWHKHGLALIRPEDVRDWVERQAVINAANKLYGKRKEQVSA